LLVGICANSMRLRQQCPRKTARGGARFLERIHAVLNAIDAAPFVTIAAVHVPVSGEDSNWPWLRHDYRRQDGAVAFPELRLGFIPGFGGIPRLKRDLGNALVRDLLFTGQTVNATRAHAVGLVAQLAGEGEALASHVRPPRKSRNTMRDSCGRQEILQNQFHTMSCGERSTLLRALHSPGRHCRPEEIRRRLRPMPYSTLDAN